MKWGEVLGLIKNYTDKYQLLTWTIQMVIWFWVLFTFVSYKDLFIESFENPEMLAGILVWTASILFLLNFMPKYMKRMEREKA